MTVVIQKLEIANGRILVGTPGVRGKERVYENVNLEVSDLSLTSQFPFRVTAKTPGGGTVTLDGKAGPLSATDVADTPFQATADVSHLDVATTGFIDPASGLAGVIDFKGSLASAAGRLTSKGAVTRDRHPACSGRQARAGTGQDRLRVRLQQEGADRRGEAGRRAHRQGVGASHRRLQRQRPGDRRAAETRGSAHARAGSRSHAAGHRHDAADGSIPHAGHVGRQSHHQRTNRSPRHRGPDHPCRRNGRRFRSRRQTERAAVALWRADRSGRRRKESHGHSDPCGHASRRAGRHPHRQPEPRRAGARRARRGRHDRPPGESGFEDARRS